jgi:glutathione synthase/RimK-type ligase-like ATP-grasp enzyme
MPAVASDLSQSCTIQMILILTEPGDLHADRVTQKLHDRSAPFVRFNPAEFPRHARLSVHFPGKGNNRYVLQAHNESVELSTLKAIWYRRPRAPVVHDCLTDTATRTAIQQECESFLYDIWSSIGGMWVPGPPFVLRRWRKVAQLDLAQELGFEIPPTLITSSPDELVAFYQQHNGNIVSKRVGFSFLSSEASPFFRYTDVVTKRDIGYAQAIRFSPMIFQAYVPKELELRITVVGSEVFAAEIHSQETNHTRYDWRRYDPYHTPYLPHELPLSIAQRCVQLVRRMGLTFGAIDMILTPEGRYVFIEINANGQYLWIEYATGLPISDAVCDLLILGSNTLAARP